MKVYLLMEYGGQDESDKVLGTFLHRKDAVATMTAIEGLPWTVHNTDFGIHRDRAGEIEGHEWGFCQYAIDDFRPEKDGQWPPKARIGIEEREVMERPLTITKVARTVGGEGAQDDRA